MEALKPPDHLRPEMQEWWIAMRRKYALGLHQVPILTAACEAHDRATCARLAIQEHGVTYNDRFGQPKVRPEVLIDRDNKSLFMRLVASMYLDPDDLPEE